jgi:hypothetical protein
LKAATMNQIKRRRRVPASRYSQPARRKRHHMTPQVLAISPSASG